MKKYVLIYIKCSFIDQYNLWYAKLIVYTPYFFIIHKLQKKSL